MRASIIRGKTRGDTIKRSRSTRFGDGVMKVPTLTGNVGAEYRIGADRYCLAGGELYASPIHQYVGARRLDLQNRFDLKSCGIANSRVGWQREKADVCTFAHNLPDERFEAYGVCYGPGAETVRPGAASKF